MSILEPRPPGAPPAATPKQAKKWLTTAEGLDYMRRKEKGKRVRSEKVIAFTGKAIEQAFETMRPVNAMFKLRDALKILREIEDTNFRAATYPQKDDVLSLIDDLGSNSLAFVKKCSAFRQAALDLQPDLEALDAFLRSNPVLLENRRQLVSEQQMIEIYIARAEKKNKLKRKIEPMEIETMVQLTAVHEGKDLANAPASLQDMSERWRSNRKKVRRRLLVDLEFAAKKATVMNKKKKSK